MAKALLGHMSNDRVDIARLHTGRLAAENRALRERVADLETLILRLTEENDALASAGTAALLTSAEDMQPA